MGKSNVVRRLLSVLVCICLSASYSLQAWAGVVSTEQLMKQQSGAQSQSSLMSLLDREDVQEKLVSLGVDPDDAKRRVVAMSDEQLAQVQTGVEGLPAGSGVLELLLAVLLILIILDVVGVTNIFSFINSPSSR
jgi:hypothetical protein